MHAHPAALLFAQALVALGGTHGVALADDLAQPLDGRSDIFHLRSALVAVAVEQVLGCELFEHPLKLPGQVDRVAQALAHALCQEGRHLVRAVAGEQHAGVAPLLGNHRMETVGRRAPDARVRGGEPGGEQLPDGLGRHLALLGLVGQQQELPSPVRARADDVGAGPRGVAVLDIGGGQPMELVFVHVHVDHDPGLVEVEAPEREPHLLADRAGAAIAAHGIARAQLHLGAVGPPHAEQRMVRRLAQRQHLVPQVDRHRGELADGFAQRGFQRRLVEGVRRRPCERVGRRSHVEVLDRLAVASLVDRRAIGRHVRRQRAGNADLLEHAQRLVVEREGARQRVDLLRLVEDRDAQAALAEQGGERCADRAEADDRHVDGLGILLEHGVP